MHPLPRREVEFARRCELDRDRHGVLLRHQLTAGVPSTLTAHNQLHLSGSTWVAYQLQPVTITVSRRCHVAAATHSDDQVQALFIVGHFIFMMSPEGQGCALSTANSIKG